MNCKEAGGRTAKEGRQLFNQPVEILDEGFHLIARHGAVVTHVAVVGQHQHRDVPGHAGQFALDVVKGPAEKRIIYFIFFSL